MRFFPGSLLWRTLIVLVAALVLSQATAMWLLHRFVDEPRHAAIVGHFVSHLKTIGAAMGTMTPAEQERFMTQLAEKEGIRMATATPREGLQPVGDLPPMRFFRERLREIFGPQAEVYAPGPAARLRDRGGRPRELWIRLPAGGRDFWIAFPRRRIERDSTLAFIAWGAAGIAIAIAGTFFLMFRLNRPLAQLGRAAAKLGKGGDPPPVPETGPSEIRAVARAFNQMKEDLQKSQRERATFLAGISHDLRTPLARLRLEVEMLEGRIDAHVLRGIVGDLDDMNAIIDQFIDFTRTEASEPLTGVDLTELARACAERAARGGMNVRCELDAVPLLAGRPLALRRLVDNLLANAARHAGGEVTVRTGTEPGAAVLQVLDRGPGIPPELVERLKQPFTRRDEARSGSSGAGLGLAIADRVARLHGGRIDLLPREGGGLDARLTLPLAS